MTYEEALTRLKQIVYEVENGQVDIDQLKDKIQEARKLFEFCINKLNAIEAEVKEIIEQDWKKEDVTELEFKEDSTDKENNDEILPF